MRKQPSFELQYALMARATQDVIENPGKSPAEALWQRFEQRRLDPAEWYLPDGLFPIMAIVVGFAVYGEQPEAHYRPGDFNLEKIFREAA